MASKTGMKPTAERIRELYSYDKDTGIFSRRTAARKWGGLRRRGTIGAGSVSTHGYVMIAVDGTNYIAGNVAWAYVHGEWPRGRIRYRNGNKADNRFDNLLVVGDGQDVLQSRRLTVERLKELLHYEPTTGWFTWRVASTIAAVGERAGGRHGHGYRMIGIDYKKFLEHHLAVFYMTGKWPEHEVDHINNVRDDNRWDNLRPVTRAENNRNKKRDRPGKVGFTGVHLCGEKYRAAFNDDYKTTHIGVFATIAEARVARLLMEIDKFGLCTSFCERDEVLPIGDGRFMKIELVRSDTDGLIAYDSHGVPVHVKSVETVTDLIAAWHGGEWPASKIDEDKFSAGVTNALVGFGA